MISENSLANASLVPQYRFADTLKEQEAQLAANPLLQRFAESRRRMAADPYRPSITMSARKAP